MKAIVINPVERKIFEVELAPKNLLKQLYKLLTDNSGVTCDLVQPMDIDARNTLWVDEEGALKRSPTFQFGPTQLLCGAGVILGYDANTDSSSRSTSWTVEDVERHVTWDDRVSTGKLTRGREVEPPPGYNFAYVGGRPLFEVPSDDN